MDCIKIGILILENRNLNFNLRFCDWRACPKKHRRRRKLTMTTLFCNIAHVEPPHNTTQETIVVSTLHAMVETTSSSDKSVVRKSRFCSMPTQCRIEYTLLSGGFGVRLKRKKCCNMVTYTIIVDSKRIRGSIGGQIERTGHP